MSNPVSYTDKTKLVELLDADGTAMSRQCADALHNGAIAQPLKESTAIAQHLSWLNKHREGLASRSGPDEVDRFLAALEDPQTESVVLTSVGLNDEALLPDAFYTVALDAPVSKVIAVLALARGLPGRTSPPGVHQR